MCKKCDELWDKLQAAKKKYHQADTAYRKQAIEECDDKEEQRKLRAGKKPDPPRSTVVSDPEATKEYNKKKEKKTVDKEFF